ncbi:hypothetical protein GCM10018775_47350 [Streptomyces umbrinus]|nr:hypothetical protein GCM10018775_47350 [Streptomyces umbrinus]
MGGLTEGGGIGLNGLVLKRRTGWDARDWAEMCGRAGAKGMRL